MSRFIDKYNAIQAVGTKVEIPYGVYRILGNEVRALEVVGNEISLGEDFCSLENARAALEWYVQQLGGTVKWPKDGGK